VNARSHGRTTQNLQVRELSRHCNSDIKRGAAPLQTTGMHARFEGGGGVIPRHRYNAALMLYSGSQGKIKRRHCTCDQAGEDLQLSLLMFNCLMPVLDSCLHAPLWWKLSEFARLQMSGANLEREHE